MSAVEPSPRVRISKALPTPWSLEANEYAIRLGREIAGIIHQDDSGRWSCSVFHPRPARPRRPVHLAKIDGETFRRRRQAIDRVVSGFHDLRTVGS